MLDFSITFFITLINIAVLFVFLRKVLFKPVTKFMEARTAKIQAEIENAEKNREEAKSLRQLYENKMKSADAESTENARKMIESAEKHAERIIADAKLQAETIIAQGRKQLSAERQAAMITFRSEAAALVMTAAGHLLRRKMDANEDRSYTEQLLQQLGNKV